MAPESLGDVIIVGSGPAGVAAALALTRRQVVPTMLDVGLQRSFDPPAIETNFFAYARQHDVSDLLLGREFEGLYNLNPEHQPISFYLTAPKNRFVVDRADQLQPVAQNQTAVVQSLAKGGLANAWGCAAYRYLDRDLARFPIDATELEPYYDLLTQEIGICGADDDLSRFQGSTRFLQPPFQLPRNSSRILQNYQRHRRRLNASGVYVGRMRSAILTQDLGERRGHPYLNTDLVARMNSAYNPAYTLDKLIREQRVRYIPQTLVEGWTREGDVIHVHGKDVTSGEPAQFACKRLVLAAGAVNSARMVLRSFEDYSTRLPLMDNPTVDIPFLVGRRIGKELDVEGYGSAALAAAFDWEHFATPLHAPIFETMLVPRAEFFRHTPFHATFNLKVTKYLLPAMVVMVLFFPSDESLAGTIALRPDGTLAIDPPTRPAVPQPTIRRVLKVCRKLGMYSHASLAETLRHGGSIHYAGTLGMRHDPGPYQTDRDGRLGREPAVCIVDGGALSSLSAKNHTLTIMANAMRICSRLCDRGWE